MNTETRPADMDATHAHDGAMDSDVRPPAGWPLTLQTAIGFWAVLAAVLAYGIQGGGLWGGLLALIAADYVWYLRTDEGMVVTLLKRAPWNRPPRAADGAAGEAPVATGAAEAPGSAGAGAAPMRIRDISVREMLTFAREETDGYVAATRRNLGAMTTRHKANGLRAAVATVGLLVAFFGAPVGVAIAVLAGLDLWLERRAGVSAAGLVFGDADAHADADAPRAEGVPADAGSDGAASSGIDERDANVDGLPPWPVSNGQGPPIERATPGLPVAAPERGSWRSAA